jgi:hypothetical protein
LVSISVFFSTGSRDSTDEHHDSGHHHQQCNIFEFECV